MESFLASPAVMVSAYFPTCKDGHRYVGQGGGINGFSNTMDSYPDDNLVVVVQANTDSSVPLEMATTIAHIFLGMIKDLPIEQEEVKIL